jgi:hypothetical protein
MNQYFQNLGWKLNEESVVMLLSQKLKIAVGLKYGSFVRLLLRSYIPILFARLSSRKSKINSNPNQNLISQLSGF